MGEGEEYIPVCLGGWSIENGVYGVARGNSGGV